MRIRNAGYYRASDGTLSTASRPEGTLYRELSDVIKPPMDAGTVVNRLKRGLCGSVRDLLLDVELFMAKAIRFISPPAAVEGGDLLPMDLEPLLHTS
jgi:hypothetical protein